MVVVHAQQVAGVVGRNHRRFVIAQAPQGGEVEMIHVGMRKQDQVRPRESRHLHCRFHQTFQADGQGAEVDPDLGTEHRVREDREPIDREIDGAVSDPRGMQSTSVATRWRFGRRGAGRMGRFRSSETRSRNCGAIFTAKFARFQDPFGCHILVG